MSSVDDARTLLQDIVVPDLKALGVRVDALESNMKQRFDSAEKLAEARHGLLLLRMDTGFAAADAKATTGFAAADAKATAGFGLVDAKFAAMLAAMDARFTAALVASDAKFAGLQAASDAKFAAMLAAMDMRFAAVDARFAVIDAKLDTIIRDQDIKRRLELLEAGSASKPQSREERHAKSA